MTCSSKKMFATLLVLLVTAAPSLAVDRDEAGLEDPDEAASNKFYERGYLSETQALELQTEEGDRVEKTVLELSPRERTTLGEQARVHVFTDTYTVYEIYRPEEEQPYRYALPIKQPGQHKFMDLMYGIDRDGTIHRVDLMIYREPYGGEIESRRFMSQFEDRSLEDSSFRVNFDVVHIQGATISAKATSRGARKVLTLLDLKGFTSDK